MPLPDPALVLVETAPSPKSGEPAMRAVEYQPLPSASPFVVSPTVLSAMFVSLVREPALMPLLPLPDTTLATMSALCCPSSWMPSRALP